MSHFPSLNELTSLHFANPVRAFPRDHGFDVFLPSSIVAPNLKELVLWEKGTVYDAIRRNELTVLAGKN